VPGRLIDASQNEADVDTYWLRRKTLAELTLIVDAYKAIITLPLACPFFGIRMSLGSLAQGIRSINDRSYLSCLNEVFEEN
jgi:hypothetical protein